MTANPDPASFRDPSGFVYRDDNGVLFRQIHAVYLENYRRLMDTGLYQDLIQDQLMVEHAEVPIEKGCTPEAVFVIQPKPVSFISYPYEWCFSQLRDAARLTLEVQRRALRHGMVLKDCSAYNVVFEGPRPIFIDTLSFEPYVEGKPWAAYRQFCQHFLAPLALSAHVDTRLTQLLRIHLDGIAVTLAARLLPRKTWLRPGLALHLHAQAWFQHRDEVRQKKGRAPSGKSRVSRNAHLGLLDSLDAAINALSLRDSVSEWSDYYETHSYTEAGVQKKQELVKRFLQAIRPTTVWDLGANTGCYARLAAEVGAHVTAFEMDPACVELMYQTFRKESMESVLPLCFDLANPSPNLGWAQEERRGWIERGPVDLVMALALVHHLGIGNNLPFSKMAACFARLAPGLIIEFIPKDDPQTQRLLESREDVFFGYSVEHFESAFARWYVVCEKEPIPGGGRILYRMERISQTE